MTTWHESPSGAPYASWWEPDFPYHVFVDNNSPLPWYYITVDIPKWIYDHYPRTHGNTNISRFKQIKPYQDFDWGTDVIGNMVIVYFKDAKMAAHFKLVWG